MKKFLIPLLALMLAGCATRLEIQPDTIVEIPLHPTTVRTEPVTEATEAPTPPPTEAPTEKPRTASEKSESKPKPTTPKATEPPTQPPTEPPTEPPTRPSVELYVPDGLDTAIAEAVNAQRVAAGLAPLSLSSQLYVPAAQRARELSVNWSHTRPDGSGFETVLTQWGVSFTAAGECLYNTGSAPDIPDMVAKWMAHGANSAIILDANASAMGVAHDEADGFTYIAVIIIS